MVIIIGGGPAGIMAALTCAKQGEKVTLLEKNEKTCKKLYITGKGRCNLTNTAEGEDFFVNIVNNQKFLMSSFHTFDNKALMKYFIEELRVPLVVERGGRVFPESQKSADITDALRNELKRQRIIIKCDFEVKNIKKVEDKFFVSNDFSTLEGDKVIIATGGITYPMTGSTGDGYEFAKSFNHTVITPCGALVGLKCDSSIDLAGLTLKNIQVSITDKNGKVLAKEFGEMLFTHTGISGPTVLTLSSRINRQVSEKLYVKIDLKPALDTTTLDMRLQREFESNHTKQLSNILLSLCPKSLVAEIIKKSNLKGDILGNQITKSQRAILVETFKNLTYTLKGLEDISGAIITSGGINTKEINPKTMESKLVKGLHFAGEVIDIDALTGGFNLQIAFSTGYTAGYYAAQKE